MKPKTKLKNKKARMKSLVIIAFIIVCAIILLLIIMSVIRTAQVHKDSSLKQSEKTKDTETGTETEQPIKELDESEIEMIKIEIVTGERDEVPAEIGKPKDIIIKEYLYTCFMISDVYQRIECYEVYYLSNDPGLKQQKEGCEVFDEPERTKCFDEYYYKLTSEGKGNFCDAIIDSELKKECELIG